MTHPLHIVAAQINPVVGDIEYNLNKIRRAWDDAPDGTDIIAFPELSVCGYAPEDMVTNTAFLDAVKKAVRTLARESKDRNPWIVIGAPLAARGKIFNAAHVIGDGKIQATVRKRNLPNYGVFDEQRWFSPGPHPKPVEFKGYKIGFIICEDMWHPGPAAALKKKGAELLISLNASPYDTGKDARRLAEMRMRVMETGLPLIYVNQCGGQDDLIFDGSSFVMNAQGDVVLQAAEFDECAHDVQFPLTLPAPPKAGTKNKAESAYKALTAGLRDYVRKNGFSDVLLGLSGGIDSALTAVIAADALGGKNVHAVFMPSKYTSKESGEDANAVAKNLNIKMETVSIESQVSAFEKEMAPFFTAQTPDITFQNIQSRCRGSTLMALSNATGKMVLSTGNKSEIAAGYATLYGDMCGGYSPLKDVYKTQVYELARWRNSKGAVIPDRVLTKAPTAELKPGQTDQDTLPPYETLDSILECLIEQDMGLRETVGAGHDRATVLKVWRMLNTAEYKRRQAPPGPRISCRAFARERRWPMTNGYTKIIEK